MNPRRLLECVPNFSEGRNRAVIDMIAGAIEEVDGVRLLSVDPGRDTNRTVMTFVGEPEAVVEAAFQSARVAKEQIDMRRHEGAHPRFGALDVCPLVPVDGVSMEESVLWARKLGERLGSELGLTVYLYEHSATAENRRNLANLRSGEYEGLESKLRDESWKPDFGPAAFNAKSGATAVGARDFLIAYNVNLNTTSTRRANAIAFDVREKGRTRTGAGSEATQEPGSLKSVKAVGWFLDEFQIAQVSMNLTNLEQTPLHAAFEEVCEKARLRGVRVTGSELIGLVPLRSMLESGKFFLRKQHRSVGVSDRELIRITIRSLGLDELADFDPYTRIIEYAIRVETVGEPPEKVGKGIRRRLADRTVRDFTEDTASESPAPGGGSVAALVGALGAALGAMVANLSAHKRGWDERWEEFSGWAEKGKSLYSELLNLVDQDTRAFDALMSAFSMPKASEGEATLRLAAIERGTKEAIDVPRRVMRASLSSMEVLQAMAEIGNPNSVSDAGVGAACARSAVLCAALNVRINCVNLKDAAFAAETLAEAADMLRMANQREAEILRIVEDKIRQL